MRDMSGKYRGTKSHGRNPQPLLSVFQVLEERERCAPAPVDESVSATTSQAAVRVDAFTLGAPSAFCQAA